MQFWDPEKEKKFSLDRTLEQLGQGIAGNLQRRRQSLDTKFGLRALGYSDPEAEMLSGMNPQILTQLVKEKSREPLYRGWANLVNQEEGRGEYGQPEQAQATPDLSQPGATLPIAGKLQAQQPISKPRAIAGKQPYEMLHPDVAKTMLDQATKREKNQIRRDELGLKKQEVWTKRIEPLNESKSALQAVRLNLNEIRDYFRGGGVISGATQQALQFAGLDKAITNASTQAVGKATAQMVINQLGRMKGMGQVRNFFAQMVERMKPSLLNTPEGIEAISDSIEVAMDAADQIIDLQTNEYERIGNQVLKDPYSAPTNPDSFIKDKIKKINQETVKKMHGVANRHSSSVYKQETVDTIEDPTTFNTFNDNTYFYDNNGDAIGSDGTRLRKLEIRGGVPIKFID